MERISALQHKLKEKNFDALLVTTPTNIRYLSNFFGISDSERESVLFVTQTQAFLFVPRMYADHAKQTVSKDVQIISELPKGLFGSFVEYAKPDWNICCESKNMTLAEHAHIQKGTGIKLAHSSGLVEELRFIKSEDEIKSLTQASKITDKTFTHIVEFIQKNLDVGITEHDVIEELRRYSTLLSSEKFGFDPIVAVGPGSAEPHYISQNRKLERGQALLIDMGFVVNGYTSDFTRTMFLGKATEKFKHIYNLVLESQLKSIAAAKPGVNTKDLHEVSAKPFREANKEELYLHSLGHGVGLDIHEAPGISPRTDTVLEPGMVITIEPGLYLSNQFGVRIEDLAVVREDGLELLTNSSKELIEVV